MPPSAPDNSFLLGEINATVKSTADDVKAMRLEMGTLAQSVHALDQRVTEIEAERAAMKPEYQNFVIRTTKHLEADTAWKSAHDSEVATERRGNQKTMALITLMATIGAALLNLLIKVYFG